MPSFNPQLVLSSIFLGVGVWAIIKPKHVVRHTFHRSIMTTDSLLITRCLGAQAMLCGIALKTAKLTRQTYIWFGIFGSAPFLYIDLYYFFIDPTFTKYIFLDLLGNVFLVGACYLGAKQLK
ncbi:4912_t:CDS:2 [Ambispora gerdemannii]|uniref:4912_t:CDS:1 n=1 Tax=Ambispora gerdemannii TaxID=144530 RepID=A0A9N8Z8K2_9GLOM|nr:4912_t:CDS:2 [Ambispora gerdemannii]